VHIPSVVATIELARHFHLAVLIRAKQHDVELDIFVVGVHLAIAVHDLELGADFVFDECVGSDKGDGVIVGDTVHDRRRHHELAVNEQVEEEGAQHRTELVVAEFD